MNRKTLACAVAALAVALGTRHELSLAPTQGGRRPPVGDRGPARPSRP
jgi:hypothetical protein